MKSLRRVVGAPGLWIGVVAAQLLLAVGAHGFVAGGRVRVASSDGLLRSFDPKNGALVGSVEIPDGATTAPAVAGGVLYVVSTKGELHAFR